MWGPWTASPTPNFVKIAEVYYPFWENLYQKLEIFAILSYLSPHFYTHNVEMLLKRTDLGIPQRHKISLESLKGSAVIALPRR